MATLLECARGEELAAVLTFTLPNGDLAAATGISFTVKLNLDDPTAQALLLATLGQGVVVTGPTTATLTLTPQMTIELPVGRLQWAVWVALSTGEAYETDRGILHVRQSAGSPDLQ